MFVYIDISMCIVYTRSTFLSWISDSAHVSMRYNAFFHPVLIVPFVIVTKSQRPDSYIYAVLHVVYVILVFLCCTLEIANFSLLDCDLTFSLVNDWAMATEQ